MATAVKQYRARRSSFIVHHLRLQIMFWRVRAGCTESAQGGVGVAASGQHERSDHRPLISRRGRAPAWLILSPIKLDVSFDTVTNCGFLVNNHTGAYRRRCLRYKGT